MSKEWYESGWFWIGAAALAGWMLAKQFLGGCVSITPEVQTYINKAKRAGVKAFGQGSMGNACVKIVEAPGLSLRERTNITVQVLAFPGMKDFTFNMSTIENNTEEQLAKALLSQVG